MDYRGLPSLGARLGETAGRIAVDGTPEGTFAVVLGAAEAGEVRRVAGEDHVEVAQRGDLTGKTFVRARVRLVSPASPPPSGAWQLQVRLDDATRVTHLLERSLDRVDIALPVSHLSGVHEIAFRLELASAPGLYELPLPAVFLDDLIVETVDAAPGLVNRQPEPGETGVPVGSLLALELASSSASPVDATTITVNGVAAYVNGIFQTGWDGVYRESVVIDGGRTLRVVIDPTTNLTPQTTYVVRVISKVAGGSSTLDATYSFVTEDLAVPQVLSARATSSTTLEVTWNEPVTQLSAANTEDALYVENWALDVASTSLDDGLPAVPIEVVSARGVDASTIELTVNRQMTRDALYRVTGTGIADLAGNLSVSPTNQAVFAGVGDCVRAGALSLYGLVPQMNRDEDHGRDLKGLLACMQEPLDALLCDIDRWTDIFDPDRCPSAFLDLLLHHLGNPFSMELTELEKRRLARVLVDIYRSKGTDPGIIDAIRLLLGIEVTIVVPAFENIWVLGLDELGDGSVLGSSDAGTRLTFWVVVPHALTDDERAKMSAVVDYMKRAECHFLIKEPVPPPPIPDHLELGLSELGVTWFLHL